MIIIWQLIGCYKQQNLTRENVDMVTQGKHAEKMNLFEYKYKNMPEGLIQL